MIEIQGVATDRNDVFPYSGMRILGFIQLINGAIIFFLGVGDLTSTMVNYDTSKQRYGSRYDIIVSMTVASTPLWCGIWFAVTGSLGTCISRAKAHTLQFFKIAFLILNILCAALFGPVCAVVSVLIAMTRHSLDHQDYQWMMTLLIGFLSVLEIVMAIATGSVTCCCSPLRGTQVHVMINQNQEARGASTDKLNVSNISGKSQADNSSQLDSLNTSNPNHNHNYNNNNNSNSNSKPHQHEEEVRASMEESRQVAPASHKFDGFADSNPIYGSYAKLKKWALPGQW